MDVPEEPCVGRESSDGVATRYGLDGRGSDPGGAVFSAPPRPSVGPTQSLIISTGTASLSRG
jgi:hypothetical protein